MHYFLLAAITAAEAVYQGDIRYNLARWYSSTPQKIERLNVARVVAYEPLPVKKLLIMFRPRCPLTASSFTA